MGNKIRPRKHNYRIDIHHHIIPDFYRDALSHAGIQTSFGQSFPKWSPEETIKVMNTNRIATAFTSISTPGVYFGDTLKAIALARECNEFAAKLKRDFPGRFGAFASLPLPDVESAIKEIEYALDTLKLDGVVLMSNVAGRYPGEPAYNSLLAELNKRKAIVFIHPNDPPDKDIPEYMKGVLDAALDTTRAVMSLLYAGYLKNYSNIRIILSHAGGIVPYMTQRIALGAIAESGNTLYDQGMFDFLQYQHGLQESIRLLAGLYYDSLSPAGNTAFQSVLALTDPSHILLATDYVFLPKVYTGKKIAAIKSYKGFDRNALAGIERENALKLFPYLKEL